MQGSKFGGKITLPFRRELLPVEDQDLVFPKRPLNELDRLVIDQTSDIQTLNSGANPRAEWDNCNAGKIRHPGLLTLPIVSELCQWSRTNTAPGTGVPVPSPAQKRTARGRWFRQYGRGP